ncbi:D-fructose 1,6-bisphosphatase [Natronoarchaeum philippinense]|uniref:Fructose-1,6-bisphosphatase class 1 n=1 Tax=Natronoarchaeum philippinense TaxID=558529 RepID=A0A285NTF9_NATPI|nr:class 1 fructose-bisphosphatase [Natronoarchaeum philippinense]SNZ12498.1 D-fructose 1,6-bisphosphatase [Natronoarchaeum philippinense]
MSTVDAVVDAVVEIAPDLRAALAETRGTKSGRNPSGDQQSGADRALDDLFYEALAALDGVGEFASEERDGVEDVGEGFSVAIDPLDGSSNLRSNTTVGAILAVYDADLPASGEDLLAGMVLVFGPATTLTVAADGEATEHVLDDGEIVDSSPVSLTDAEDVWGLAGGPDEWSDSVTAFADDLYHRAKLRYTGAMVADVQHLLAIGGIVGYPAQRSRPDGVLRLQYESNPVAYLVECAGGAASTGDQRILDVEPSELHERIPTFFGTQSLIDELEERIGE